MRGIRSLEQGRTKYTANAGPEGTAGGDLPVPAAAAFELGYEQENILVTVGGHAKPSIWRSAPWSNPATR